MSFRVWDLFRAVPLALLCWASTAQARNLLSADGPGGTYELIRTAYTTELPDCGHMVPHITEAFDDELRKNVFVFHAHVNQDDDRCGGQDRQRTEIRARASDIVAQEGETVFYSWKFRLDRGFQGSSRFTHIFQIKSDLGAPIMTLTPRVSTFGITGRASGDSDTTDLAKFRGVWAFVTLRVVYSDNGRIDLNIRRLSDGQVLYSYAGSADMWDDNASGHDSKFGIYRSLDDRGALRDEQVRFADFCASKVNARECEDTGGGGRPMPPAPPTPPTPPRPNPPPDPGAGALTFEAESLMVVHSGTGTTVQSDATASGGRWVSLDAENAGSWMEFTLPDVPAGSYNLAITYKTGRDRGRAKVLLDDDNDRARIGGTVDQWDGDAMYDRATVGQVTLSAGDHRLRLVVQDKNGMSDGFILSADSFTLTPVQRSEVSVAPPQPWGHAGCALGGPVSSGWAPLGGLGLAVIALLLRRRSITCRRRLS